MRAIFRNSLLIGAAALALVGFLYADIASRNLSRAPDQSENNRLIVFYNGITNEYIIVVKGLCSFGNPDKSREIPVICKSGPSSYKKHIIVMPDNAAFYHEQIDAAPVNTYHYRVISGPSAIGAFNK